MSILYSKAISQMATVPEEKMPELLDFINFLKVSSSPAVTTKPKRKAGIAKDPNFYMADDFDAPLEEFKEYV